jgi:hypothetical protein
VDRAHLQELAILRLTDAEALLAADRWDGAYYLPGYCIECALKACVTKQFRLHEMPDKQLVNSFYTHRLDELPTISGVKSELQIRSGSDANFKVNWNTVKDWNETIRYEIGITQSIAKEMYDAVNDASFGIFPWLKTLW